MLSFDEWKSKYAPYISAPDEVKAEFKEFHNVDFDKEVANAYTILYDDYVAEYANNLGRE